jgi:uncharacterized protein
MIIDLKSIAGKYGANIPFEYQVALSDISLYGSFPFQTPGTIRGQIQNHLGALKVSGVIEALYETSCARCLKPLHISLSTSCDVVLTQDAENEDARVFFVPGEAVELDDIFVPALILDIPMTYLCREDCKGLCQRCGRDLNEGECGCSKRQVDDRLAILKTLLPDEGDA